MRLSPLLLAALLLAGPAFSAPFVTDRQVDLSALLPPPPAAGSALDRAELGDVAALERSRTAERAALARADAEETVFAAFGSVLGPKFVPPALPLARALFERLAETEEAVTGAAKEHFARPRPYIANPALNPVVPRSRSFAYPSGHATVGAIMGIVLAAMVPERRPALFARMDEYAESRVIGGAHYRSDIVAGRLAGTAVDAVLFNDPAFLAAYAPARAEVRRALGLAE